MILQILIIVIFIIIGLMVVKADHQSRKVKIIVMIIIGFLIYFSVVNIFTSDQIDLKSPRGIVQATYVYFGWIGQSAANLWDVGVDTVHLVGNAIKFNNTEEQPQR